MATPHKKGFLYKPRHRKIRSRSFWVVLRLTHLNSLVFILWRIACPNVYSTCLSGLVNASEKVPDQLFYEGFIPQLTKNLRAPIGPLHIVTVNSPSTSKSQHMYTHVYIYICYLNRGFLLLYIHIYISNSATFAIDGFFSFFAFLLSISISNYY